QLHVSMAEERPPPHERRRVTKSFGPLQRFTELDDGGVDVALEEGDQAQLAARTVRPSLLAEPLREGERLAPRLLGERWIEVGVRLPFDHETAQAKAFVALHDRVGEVLGQACGDLR